MRLSTKLVLFNFWLNAAAILVVRSGIAAAWGVSPQPGGEDKIQKANETANETVGAGGLGGETLAGMFVDAAQTAKVVFEAVFAAPVLFTNLGVPEAIVVFLFAPLYIIVAMDIMYTLTGRAI